GNLVHAIIEGAVRSLEGNGGLSSASEEAVKGACAQAAGDVARAFEVSEAVPPARIWRITVTRAAAMAEAALLPSFLEPLPGQRSWAELPFGRVHRRDDGSEERDPGLPWDPHAEV